MKTKIIIGVLSAALAVLICVNANYYKKEREREGTFMVSLYTVFGDAAGFLSSCCNYYENGDFERSFISLDKAYGELIKLDTMIRSFSSEFNWRYGASTGIVKLIANCLLYFDGEIPYIKLNGIKLDGSISGSEAIFITRLANDLMSATEKFENYEQPINEGIYNKKLSIKDARRILDEFCENWNWINYYGRDDENPYRLLAVE